MMALPNLVLQYGEAQREVFRKTRGAMYSRLNSGFRNRRNATVWVNNDLKQGIQSMLKSIVYISSSSGSVNMLSFLKKCTLPLDEELYMVDFNILFLIYYHDDTAIAKN